eukprot:scaffold26177_cov58-Phaeocystis_antarctica.AAC.1
MCVLRCASSAADAPCSSQKAPTTASAASTAPASPPASVGCDGGGSGASGSSPQRSTPSASQQSPSATASPEGGARRARNGPRRINGPRTTSVAPGGARKRSRPCSAAPPCSLRRCVPRLTLPPAHTVVGASMRTVRETTSRAARAAPPLDSSQSEEPSAGGGDAKLAGGDAWRSSCSGPAACGAALRASASAISARPRPRSRLLALLRHCRRAERRLHRRRRAQRGRRGRGHQPCCARQRRPAQRVLCDARAAEQRRTTRAPASPLRLGLQSVAVLYEGDAAAAALDELLQTRRPARDERARGHAVPLELAAAREHHGAHLGQAPFTERCLHQAHARGEVGREALGRTHDHEDGVDGGQAGGLEVVGDALARDRRVFGGVAQAWCVDDHSALTLLGAHLCRHAAERPLRLERTPPEDRVASLTLARARAADEQDHGFHCWCVRHRPGHRTWPSRGG